MIETRSEVEALPANQESPAVSSTESSLTEEPNTEPITQPTPDREVDPRHIDSKSNVQRDLPPASSPDKETKEPSNEEILASISTSINDGERTIIKEVDAAINNIPGREKINTLTYDELERYQNQLADFGNQLQVYLNSTFAHLESKLEAVDGGQELINKIKIIRDRELKRVHDLYDPYSARMDEAIAFSVLLQKSTDYIISFVSSREVIDKKRELITKQKLAVTLGGRTKEFYDYTLTELQTRHDLLNNIEQEITKVPMDYSSSRLQAFLDNLDVNTISPEVIQKIEGRIAELNAMYAFIAIDTQIKELNAGLDVAFLTSGEVNPAVFQPSFRKGVGLTVEKLQVNIATVADLLKQLQNLVTAVPSNGFTVGDYLRGLQERITSVTELDNRYKMVLQVAAGNSN